MNFFVIIFFLLLTLTNTVFSAKILAVFHYPCKSHHILGSTLLKGLAKRGHEVTMISPFPFKQQIENYRDIDVTGMLDFKEKHIVPKFVGAHNVTMLDKMTFSIKNVKAVAALFLNHPSYKKLLNEHFDLIILNWSMNEAFLAIGHHFKAPVIVFSTIGSSQLTNKITRNSAPYSYIPNLFVTYSEPMSFLERVSNTFFSIYFELVDYYANEKIQRELLKEYFPNAPPLQDLIDKVSLIFLNSHYAIEGARPFVPNMIEIGGFHVEEPKRLKSDLKEFLDNASEGAIFFSLGTNIKSSHLPKEKLEQIVDCFAKLKLKVLWKFEKHFDNLPSNVLVDEWFPQTDILAHPNLKVFVTHGGRLSTIETLHYAVPIIGIPFFSDQEYNVGDCVNKGYGIKLDYQTLTTESLTNAIQEVVSNPKYKKNVKIRSDALKDQPLTLLDTAIYWVEYVIRHKGAFHLQSAAIKLTWYQRMLLDVIAFIALIFILLALIIYFTMKASFNYLKRICCKKANMTDLKKKKNK